MKEDLRIGSLFQGLGAVLAQRAEPVVVLRLLLEQAAALVAADRGIFVEIGSGGEPEFRVLHHLEPRDLSGDSGSYSRSVCEHVARSGETIRISDARRDPRFMASGSVHRLRLVALLCVPIRVRERVAAIVQLQSDAVGHFSGEHEDLVKSLAQVGGPLLEVLQASDTVLRDRAHLRAEAERSRKEIAAEWSFRRFIGGSAVVRKLETEIQRLARAEFTVLLLGETGTGKSILARILHYSSPRAEGPFVHVSAPNLLADTVESALFGHCKGAFTGATQDREGYVSAAEGGTLFLDEIGELPLHMQPKLLRLLEERTYERLGETRERHADARIIAATSRDLEADVQAGRFRKELYYRLNAVPIQVPPLRERREDIPLLLRHFLDKIAGGRWIRLADDVPERLVSLDHAWEGNIRDLRTLAERLSLDAGEAPIAWEDVRRRLGKSGGDPGSNPVMTRDLDLRDAKRELIKEKIGNVLAKHPRKTREEQAKILGVSPATYYRWLRELNLGD